jgi:nickel transport protein
MVIRERSPMSNLQGERIIAFASVLLLFLSFSAPARAHKVSLFAWVEGDTVYTESYFGGERKAVGGLIRVFDPSGKQLLEGKTDDKGEFSFRIPRKVDLKIVLEATMGHKTEFILRAEKPGDIQKGSEPAPEKGESPVPPSPSIGTDAEQIRQMMEEALDARLKPIARTLAKIRQEKGPGLTEILGGIGYIFGLMGVALYFGSRRKDRS